MLFPFTPFSLRCSQRAIPSHNTRGVALMAVLGVALMLGFTLVFVLSLSLNRAKSSRHGLERMGAVYAAEAGYWWALAKIMDDPTFTNPAGSPYELTLSGTPRNFNVDVEVRNLDALGHKKIHSRVVYEDF